MKKTELFSVRTLQEHRIITCTSTSDSNYTPYSINKSKIEERVIGAA